MPSIPWQPTAPLSALRARAQLYQRVRGFFCERNVLEVEVPLVAAAAVTDPHIESLALCDSSAEQMYLQSSPEFAMKRLLAAGSGAIYCLGKAFRQGESGRRHNPEFTLLEWYRPDFDDHRLMDEVSALIELALPIDGVNKHSYRAVFERQFGIDPHTAAVSALKDLARQYASVTWDDDNRDTWLDLLMTHAIEPVLGEGLTFIYDYPASQAALAKVVPDQTGQPVARRFEAFLGGMELANGYWELTDASEQQRRFDRDLNYRRARGQRQYPVDRRLLAALASGLPEVAGVALGIDRLLMLITKAGSIDGVLAFPHSCA